MAAYLHYGGEELNRHDTKHVVCTLKHAQGCREARGCLFFRSWVAMVCLLTEGRDAVREPVYADANETPAGQ